MHIVPEQPRHAAPIEALLEESFGPDRHKKTVYRLREGVAPIPDLCLVAEEEDGSLRGTLRFWPIDIVADAAGDGVGGQRVPALLLGPIAVQGGLRKTGVGTLLMTEGLARARALGHRIVLLVGDEPYYSRFGFRRNLAELLRLPGPVDLNRFLGLELQTGALDGLRGLVDTSLGGVGMGVDASPAPGTGDNAAQTADHRARRP
ncbi:GNAT family N-acetyltransferase [Novispirillum sp. DQ9]|uniref:GNAT family N-acetyltransferase n=1 Tax=Novispirillum sp. DQ9 TaxID=3398612 RepID=UPI003C7ADD40